MTDNRERKPHICLYIGSLQKGGAERVMVNLAEYFYGQGWHVTFVTTYYRPPEYEPPHRLWDAGNGRPFDSDNPETQRKSGESGRPDTSKDFSGIRRIYSDPPADELSRGRVYGFYARYRTLRRIWKREKPDIILSFIGYNNSFAILTSRGLGIPVVISVRSNPAYEYDSKKLRIPAFALFRHADGVVLQTHEAAEFFPEAVRHRSVILPNAVNPDFIRPRFEGERQKRVVSVGRLDDNKNQGLLIEQFALAHRHHPEYTLHLYGDGPGREKFGQLAKELGIEDSVIFEGVADNIPEEIERSSIFVLPSKTEGMPNALLEAMSLGLACIATDCPCGGPRDLIQDGVNGFLIPLQPAARSERGSQEPSQLQTGEARKPQPQETGLPTMADRLTQLMDDPDLADRLGRAATYVQEEYRPEKICGQWRDYLSGLMRKK